MHGWSSDESEDDWIAKRRKASAASDAGRVARGRGFNGGEDSAPAAGSPEDDVAELELQKDYGRYTIDPEDNWSPHRKPWAELAGGWEFSGAWSFEPDEQERCEHSSSSSRRGGGKEVRGVAAWRVEHEKGGNFTVALIAGPPGEARRLLEGKGAGRGEEPFVLEFQLDKPRQAWTFRFGRSSSRQGWKPLPWSNVHRTSFWLATLPGEDGKQHIMAGLDEFPERRFLFAKVRFRPAAVGFGPPAERSEQREPFYVRDVVVFGRASLLPPPWASRDHFVELPGKTAEEAHELLNRSGCAEKVLAPLQLPGPSALLLCRSPADASATAAALPDGVVAALVRSSEWLWPPAEGGGSPASAKAHVESVRQCWAQLGTAATRELAIFEEHTQRRTKHLEGVRIARASATRTILGSLRGAAPKPKPPEAGV